MVDQVMIVCSLCWETTISPRVMNVRWVTRCMAILACKLPTPLTILSIYLFIPPLTTLFIYLFIPSCFNIKVQFSIIPIS